LRCFQCDPRIILYLFIYLFTTARCRPASQLCVTLVLCESRRNMSRFEISEKNCAPPRPRGEQYMYERTNATLGRGGRGGDDDDEVGGSRDCRRSSIRLISLQSQGFRETTVASKRRGHRAAADSSSRAQEACAKERCRARRISRSPWRLSSAYRSALPSCAMAAKTISRSPRRLSSAY